MPPCRKADLGQSHSTYCSRTRSLKADIRTLAVAFAQRRLTTRISRTTWPGDAVKRNVQGRPTRKPPGDCSIGPCESAVVQDVEASHVIGER